MKRTSAVVFLAMILLLSTSCIINIYPNENGGTTKSSERSLVSFEFEAVKDNLSVQDMEAPIQKIQLRLSDYSSDATVRQKGDNHIVIELPQEYATTPYLREITSPGTLIFCTDASDPEGSKVMDGNDIANAQVGTDSENNYIVLLQFTEDGQKKYADVTGKIAGTGDPLYIMYDGEVISNPTTKEQINSPKCQIEGDFTYDLASSLARFIRIGTLPVGLKPIEGK